MWPRPICSRSSTTSRAAQRYIRPQPHLEQSTGSALDLKDVRGQESAKRALEIAAAGGHHMLMIGPPGAGKSMLAQRLPSILPPLEPREMLEVAMIQSIAGNIVNGGLTAERPFRAPHHSASMAALVGGGARPKPGEVALAHHGVLFLDEFPGVPAACAGCAAPAHRERRDGYRAGQSPHPLPIALSAHRGHEPVPVRPCLDAGRDLQARGRDARKATRRAFRDRFGTGWIFRSRWRR